MSVSRRTLLKTTAGLGAAAAAGLPLLAPRRARAAAYTAAQVDAAMAKMKGRTLVIASWGGSWQDALRNAWWKPFSEKYGVKIVEDGPPMNPKVIAMVQSGKVTWDICDFAAYRADPLGLGGYLEPLDYSVIDATHVTQKFVSKYGIASAVAATILGYRTDVITSDPPTSMAALWDLKKYPGKRSLHDEATHNIPCALVAAGMPKDQVYPLDDAKLDKAFKKLDEIKEHCLWWTIGAQSPQQLAAKEVILAQGYNGRFDTLIDQGVPIKTVWEGGQVNPDCWSVTKNSPNKDLAMLFIAWATLPENNWEITKHITYAPANEASFPKVPENVRARVPSTYLDKQIIIDINWWGPNFDRVSDRWKEWRLKG